MFTLCEGMKWAHLPVAGGLYDQHPQLIDEFTYIFQLRAEKEAKRQEAEARKAKATSRGASRSRR